jgi:hypothetical protein
MRSSRCGVVIVALSIGSLFSTVLPAQAMPGFARKYGFTCTMCHSAFPRLNDFGERYRANAYQVPGREADDQTVRVSSPPFAARTSAGFDYAKYENTPDAEDMNLFRVNGLDILSGGVLGRNIGYFLIFPPHLTESRNVAGQDGTLEMANVIFANLGSPWLNVRVGRFEPASVAFSVKRHLSIAPYEIYEYTSAEPAALSETQDGIELSGGGKSGFRYAAGWVNGSGSNALDDFPSDFYLRASKVIGPGEGLTAGQRIGAVLYSGKARPGVITKDSDDDLKGFYRAGVDASLNYAQLNLALQYVYGKEDKAFWITSEDAAYSGGFGELSYMLSTRMVFFGRGDIVQAPDSSNQDVTRFTIGARGYFEENLALHAEFSHRVEKAGSQYAGGDAKEDVATLRIDWAF